MSYKQEKIIVIVSEFINDKREYYPITDVPVEKVRFFYKDNDGLFKIMSSSDYAVRTETNETRLYITNENIKNESSKFQMGYEINFTASEYETSLPVLSVLVEMYNTLVEDSRTIFNYVKKQCFISDDKTTSLILPTLPAYTVWCMGESGEMFALPVSELYYKFDKMVETLYTEIKTLLIEDYDKFTSDMATEINRLKKELEDLKTSLANALEKLTEDSKSEITTHAGKEKETLKKELDTYVNQDKKDELNAFTKEKKDDLDVYIATNRDKLKGEKGDTGSRGEPGPVGPKGDSIKGDSIVGPTGKTGASVKSFVFNKKVNEGYEYDVNLDNGETAGKIIAPKGEKGEQGIEGKQGEKGNPGVVVETKGHYVFTVNNDGHLILNYHDSDTPPDFHIDDKGHLILTIKEEAK